MNEHTCSLLESTSCIVHGILNFQRYPWKIASYTQPCVMGELPIPLLSTVPAKKVYMLLSYELGSLRGVQGGLT